MWGILRTGKNLGTAFINGPTRPSMTENGKTINKMAKALILGMMAANIKAIGLMETCMDMESKTGQTGNIMKENTKMIKERATGSNLGPMG